MTPTLCEKNVHELVVMKIMCINVERPGQ